MPLRYMKHTENDVFFPNQFITINFETFARVFVSDLFTSFLLTSLFGFDGVTDCEGEKSH